MKTLPPPPLPEPLMAWLSQSIEKRLGLYFPPERWADLARGVRAAAPELGFDDARECAEWLASKPVNRWQLDLLAAHLTIGETYFFRDPKAFEALETRVLPELVRERRQAGAHQLRLWSAGCCTGEEAYSIAIAVSRAVPDWREWNIEILGTDLNPRFLRKAAEGVYSEWSFRGVPAEIRKRYFSETSDGRFEIAPRIKALVAFSRLNFAEDDYPSLHQQTNAMDVVFCRNVVMYFAREQARRVVGNLRRALVDGGWLFASAAEASPDLFAEWTLADFPGAAVYQKTSQPPPPSSPPPIAEAPPEPAPLPKTPPALVPPPMPAPPEIAPEPAANARALADAGRFNEALAACDKAIAVRRLDPGNHYLRGMILLEQGDLDGATAALRNALYLDPNFVVAHFAQGNLMRRRGRTADAQRCFDNARSLLDQSDADAVLPESDGLTAGRLLAILDAAREATP